MTGEWLAFCSACPVPEIANLLARAKIPFHQVTGVLDDAATWREIEEWLAAARVRAALASSRLGLMGHYYSGMLDIMTDVTLLSIAFGAHVELLEVDELSALCADVTDTAIDRRIGEFRRSVRRAGRLPCRRTASRGAHFGGSRRLCRIAMSLTRWPTTTRARAMPPMKTR